jgi:hypothetical protein
MLPQGYPQLGADFGGAGGVRGRIAFKLFPVLRGIERLTGEHALDDPLPAE